MSESGAREEITTMRVRVEGEVQGVGFRAYAARQATALELAGWVRNRSDGTLEALVSGPTKRVEDFVSACTRGPVGARVKSIDLFAEAAPGNRGFIQLPTE